MTDRFRSRLSDYLDDALSADDRALVERHLKTCDDCAAALADLEAVVRRARSLEPREPPRDLWPDIAARLEPRPAGATPVGGSPAGANGGAATGPGESATRDTAAMRGPAWRRRIVVSVPQLAAAAVVLASLSAGVAWLAGSGAGGDASGGPVAAEAARAAPAASVVSTAGQGVGMAEYYAAAISELERVLFDPGRPLAPEAEARIRRALMTIDRALEDARRALEEAPDDPYLRQHVTDTMRRKSEFLRRAVRLAAES